MGTMDRNFFEDILSMILPDSELDPRPVEYLVCKNKDESCKEQLRDETRDGILHKVLCKPMTGHHGNKPTIEIHHRLAYCGNVLHVEMGTMRLRC